MFQASTKYQRASWVKKGNIKVSQAKICIILKAINLKKKRFNDTIQGINCISACNQSNRYQGVYLCSARVDLDIGVAGKTCFQNVDIIISLAKIKPTTCAKLGRKYDQFHSTITNQTSGLHELTSQVW